MTEKRQYFRIQQDVIFNFCPVSNDDVIHSRAEQHFEHSETLCLFSEFQQINGQGQQLMASIKESNPLIAEYLDGLNKKMDLVCQQVLSTQSSIHDVDSGRIDISQGGLAFSSDDSIGVESWLALKLIFLPAYTGVITYGQVTRNALQPDGSYLIGVRFHNLDDEQSKLIAKQVFKTQIIERQQTYAFQH
ncbi:PilZ domain-containing protein [Eionea flava]